MVLVAVAGIPARGDVVKDIVLGITLEPHGVAIQIDDEVRRIVDEAYETAKKILQEHEDLLHKIAETLVEKETLDGKEIDAIIEATKPGLVFTPTVTAEDVVLEERRKADISQPKPEPQENKDPVDAKERDLPKDKLGETQA